MKNSVTEKCEPAIPEFIPCGGGDSCCCWVLFCLNSEFEAENILQQTYHSLAYSCCLCLNSGCLYRIKKTFLSVANLVLLNSEGPCESLFMLDEQPSFPPATVKSKLLARLGEDK